MAGLLGTALAGALAGGGSAVQWNAQTSIEQKRQAALNQLDHDMAMERQNDQQKYATRERVAGEDFTAGQNRLDRTQQIRLADQQQAGANYRSQSDGWSLVPTEDGGYVRYNTITGEKAPAPEGISTAGLLNGAMTDRQQAQVDYLQAQIEANADQLYGDGSAMLTPEQKAQLELEGNQLRNQLEGALGMGSQRGVNLLDQLAAMRGGSTEASQGEPTGQRPTTAREKIDAAREEDLAQQAKRQTEQRVESLTEQADTLIETMTPQGRDDGGVLGVSAAMMESGAYRTDPRFASEAQAVADELMAIHDDPSTSEFQRRQIMETLSRLQDLGAQLQ